MWRPAKTKPQDRIKVLCEEGEGWFFTRGKVYDGCWIRRVNEEGREKVFRAFAVVDNYGECYVDPNRQFTIIEGSKTPPEE